MLKFVNNPQYSDVILEFPEEESCEKKFIYAHRLLLSKYPYFEKMIDDLCGYEDSTEESKSFLEEFPDEWSGLSSHENSMHSVKISTVNSEDSFPPEEEKERAIEDIEESKSDIEFTEEFSVREQSFCDKILSEPPNEEDYLSDEDDIELPLKINMNDISYDTCLDIVRYIYTDY